MGIIIGTTLLEYSSHNVLVLIEFKSSKILGHSPS